MTVKTRDIVLIPCIPIEVLKSNIQMPDQKKKNYLQIIYSNSIAVIAKLYNSRLINRVLTSLTCLITMAGNIPGH